MYGVQAGIGALRRRQNPSADSSVSPDSYATHRDAAVSPDAYKRDVDAEPPQLRPQQQRELMRELIFDATPNAQDLIGAQRVATHADQR